MTSAIVAASVLAVLIGLALGLLGGGGAIVTLPMLVYVAGIKPEKAIGMSIAIIGSASLIGGTIQYWRGNVDLKVMLLFAASGMIGAFFGASVTHLVPAAVLLPSFAVLMLVVGIVMFRQRSSIAKSTACKPLRCLAAGAAVGVLTGFLGVGGGFMIVPALSLFAGLVMTKAVGTSLCIIALNSLAGIVGQLQHIDLNWGLTLLFLALALIGMAGGLVISGTIPESMLRRIFGWFVITLAIVIFAAAMAG